MKSSKVTVSEIDSDKRFIDPLLSKPEYFPQNSS
jgi:hypothetical protein